MHLAFANSRVLRVDLILWKVRITQQIFAGWIAMGPGKTQYARSGDTHIAYQVVGDGPIDVVYVPG